MIRLLKAIYKKIQNTQKFLWSHVLMIMGYIICILTILETYVDGSTEFLSVFYISNTIVIILLGCIPFIAFVIADCCTKNSTTNLQILCHNPIYNFFWHTGQLIIIFPILIFILTML